MLFFYFKYWKCSRYSPADTKKDDFKVFEQEEMDQKYEETDLKFEETDQQIEIFKVFEKSGNGPKIWGNWFLKFF